MNELEFQEEWLSAYLDDELTDEQRQVVEQRLAIDPAAQATLEDLQRVRSMVSKLPNWSGPALKFAIPAGTPGSLNEADDELDDDLENESDDLDDFEEVPRAVSGANEPRVSFNHKRSRDFSSRSLRPLLTWGVTAASLLIAAGVGSLYFWPPASSQVAYESSAPAIAAKASPRLAEMEQDNARFENFADNSLENGGLESRDSTPGAVDNNGRARSFGAPVAGEGDLGGTGLAVPSDPAPLAKEFVKPQAADAIAPQAEVPPLSDVADAKMDAAANSPLPAAPGGANGGMGGFGGAVAETNLAMNLPAADSPTNAAELPPPASMRSSGIESAEPTNAPGSNMIADNAAAGQNAQLGAAFFYARSQSWSDNETLSRLSSGAQQNRADQLAFGNSAYQRGVEQIRSEAANESVLMAAIKPEVANSPEFFQNIVNSNRLVEVDQRPLLNQFSMADAAQAVNAPQTGNNLLSNNSAANNAATGRLEAAQNNAPNNQYLDAQALNRFSNQRYQLTMPNQPQTNQPQGNSIVLFLTRDEAKQILNQLQEKGQVTSQIWTVDKQLESQAASDKQNNNEPTSQANQKSESPINNKVILLLNGPPN